MVLGDSVYVFNKPIISSEKLKLKISTKNGRHFTGIVPKEQYERSSNCSLPFELRMDTIFKRPKNELNQLFDGQFLNAQSEGYVCNRFSRNKKFIDIMQDKVKEVVGNEWSNNLIKEFVEKQLERKEHNLYQRKKRYNRKVNLAPFNYFVTITNDPSKGYSDEQFKVKLKKYFNNQADRHGWKYAGKFEYGRESTERLHFHAHVYIPVGKLCSELERVYRYNSKKGKTIQLHQNIHLAKRFGQNDFESISKLEKIYSTTAEYITKYINKDNEKVVYSRGLPSEIQMCVNDHYLQAIFCKQGHTYLLFDDIIDVLEAHQDKITAEALKRKNKSQSKTKKYEYIYSKLRHIQSFA